MILLQEGLEARELFLRKGISALYLSIFERGFG